MLCGTGAEISRLPKRSWEQLNLVWLHTPLTNENRGGFGSYPVPTSRRCLTTKSIKSISLKFSYN